MDGCAGEVVAVARGHGGSRVRVRGVCRDGLRPGEGREGAGRAPGGAMSSHAHWGARAALGTRGMGRTERGRRGPAWWHVADVEAPRLAQGGGSRWSGDAASTVGSTLTCSGARKWPAPAAFSRVLTRPLVSGSCRGSKQCGNGIGCPGIHWRGEGVEREWKCCFPEKKSGSLPPYIIASRAGKHTRGREELVGVVVKSRTHGD